MAAHPGWARTNLIANGPGDQGVVGFLSRLLAPLFSQSAAAGALPVLFAATDNQVQAGDYYGPGSCLEMRGTPKNAKIMGYHPRFNCPFGYPAYRNGAACLLDGQRHFKDRLCCLALSLSGAALGGELSEQLAGTADSIWHPRFTARTAPTP